MRLLRKRKMTTKYKYIHFIKIEDKPKTSVWQCLNNKSKAELGVVKWYPSWRQYCFFTTYQAVFNNSCLLDISDFISQLEFYRKDND